VKELAVRQATVTRVHGELAASSQH
jgi:hypothetical protein